LNRALEPCAWTLLSACPPRCIESTRLLAAFDAATYTVAPRVGFGWLLELWIPVLPIHGQRMPRRSDKVQGVRTPRLPQRLRNAERSAHAIALRQFASFSLIDFETHVRIRAHHPDLEFVGAVCVTASPSNT
jgi:hypothetical protein